MVTAKANAVLSNEKISDSSDDESSLTTAKTPDKINGTPHINVKARSASKSSDPSSESDSSNGEHEDDILLQSVASDRKAREAQKVFKDTPRKRLKFSDSQAQRIEPVKYVPPIGFSQVNTQILDSDSLLLDLIDGHGEKQIWHISAPASMSPAAIKDLGLSAVGKGALSFHHKGSSYTIRDTPSDDTTLLLPEGRKARYKRAKPGVNRTISLEQVAANLSSSARDKENSSPPIFYASKRGKNAEPRQQPEGLSERYQPYGIVKSERTAENIEAQTKSKHCLVDSRAAEDFENAAKSDVASLKNAKHSRKMVAETAQPGSSFNRTDSTKKGQKKKKHRATDEHASP